MTAMKRKYSDRANWRRVLDKRFHVSFVEEPGFTGYVSLFHILQVRDPLWKHYDEKVVCVADAGYKWLQHFPKNANYALTSMYDNKDNVVQWYIDICNVQGVTDHGVPWFDDLYLDLVVLPTGELYLLDEEELNEALANGSVTQREYDLAWAEANRLIGEYQNGGIKLLNIADRDLHRWE